MRQLFDPRIKRHRRVVDGERVPVDATHEAVWAITEDGRRWVRKRVGDLNWHGLLAEAVGWMVAREIGAPVPDGACLELQGDERSWLSERISPALHWDPLRIHTIDNVDELGAILALDALILNRDRHDQNLLLQPAPDELHLRVWAIDHGSAIGGYPKDLDAAGTNVDHPQPLRFPARLPLDLMKPGALAAAQRAARLPTPDVAEIASEACEIAGVLDLVETLTRALKRRMAAAVSITEEYLLLIGKKV
jgi:hypothetical protein